MKARVLGGDSVTINASHGDLKWAFAVVAVSLRQSFMYTAASTQ